MLHQLMATRFAVAMAKRLPAVRGWRNESINRSLHHLQLERHLLLMLTGELANCLPFTLLVACYRSILKEHKTSHLLCSVNATICTPSLRFIQCLSFFSCLSVSLSTILPPTGHSTYLQKHCNIAQQLPNTFIYSSNSALAEGS